MSLFALSKKQMVLCVSFCALLMACQPMGNATGYVPPAEEIAAIALGQDTQESISDRFGSPSYRSVSANEWYYVASQYQYPGGLPTRELRRRVLAIGFDGSGRVNAVEEYALSDGKNILISRHVTETGGRELTLWEQMRGAVGNFSAERFISDSLQE